MEPGLHINPTALAELNDRIYNRFNGTVQTGPFKGMRFENRFVWDDASNISSKVLGVYEFELHDAIRKAVARKPDTVLNCGCAEGYYAIGLGRLLPRAKVYAMDINRDCLDQCARNGLLNGALDIVLVEGKLGAKDLSRGEGHKLYMVDIEGYEISVLDPTLCPALLTSDIIVECHDFMIGEKNGTFVTDQLSKRFAASHDVERITIQTPRLVDFPFLRDLPAGLALLAITGKRPNETAWLACWAKQGDCNG